MDVIAIDQQGGKGNCSFGVNVMPTLLSDSHGTPHGVCHEVQMDEMKIVSYDGYNMAVNEKTFMTITSGASDDHHIPAVLVFKERAGCEGGGKGILIGENKSFTLSTLLDEAICYENSSGGGVAAALDASYYKGQGVRLGIEREFIAIKKGT